MRAIDAVAWLQQRIADGRIGPDEPVFPLVAHDLLAAGAVEVWAVVARQIGVPGERCDEAMRTAEAMRNWPEHHVPGTKETQWRNRTS